MSHDLVVAATWGGVAVCLAHSALFSGLNLALLGLGRLRLEVEAASGSAAAARVLRLRQDSHFLLTTILWGNVAANCLLTLLSDSILAGVGAFLFSTVGITLVGEILPQAFFSRHALRVGASLAPFVRFYQIVLFPVARPTALLLDQVLGAEEISWFREREIREVIRQHMDAEETELDVIEGRGALNFLMLDDLPVSREGEPIDPRSVIALPLAQGLPAFPPFDRSPDDPFLRRVQASRRKWVVLTDPEGSPRLVLDADAFLRDTLFGEAAASPYAYCHRPLVVTDPQAQIGPLLSKLRVAAERDDDDVIDRDLILVWSGERRVITGADLLGRILRGIVTVEPPPRGVGARS